MNKNAKIAPPRLALISHHEVPILKIRKHIKEYSKIVQEEDFDWLMDASKERRGTNPMKMSGVMLPVKGKAKKSIIPPNAAPMNRCFLFNIFYKYSF